MSKKAFVCISLFILSLASPASAMDSSADKGSWYVRVRPLFNLTIFDFPNSFNDEIQPRVGLGFGLGYEAQNNFGFDVNFSSLVFINSLTVSGRYYLGSETGFRGYAHIGGFAFNDSGFAFTGDFAVDEHKGIGGYYGFGGRWQGKNGFFINSEFGFNHIYRSSKLIDPNDDTSLLPTINGAYSFFTWDILGIGWVF